MDEAKYEQKLVRNRISESDNHLSDEEKNLALQCEEAEKKRDKAEDCCS